MRVKEKWTNDDFNYLGWHDSRIYKITFPNEELNFIIYIDYIFKWEKEDNNFFKFWVSPCKLIFKNISDLELNISLKGYVGIDIDEIKREKMGLTPNKKMTDWKFIIDTDRGVIELIATDFEMIVISQPKLLNSQDMRD